MEKLTIKDLDIAGKRVLVRVDFNVPISPSGDVVDTTRIVSSLSTIEYILQHNGIVILMSHLGRPKDTPDKNFSLKPVAKVLESLIKRPVKMAPDCIGSEVEDLVRNLKQGDILLLENLRFHRAETHPEEDPSFAKKLASLGDLYVNDAFGAAHRKHSSTYNIAQYFPNKAASGFLLEKEIFFLSQMLTKPNRPFYAIVGGAKISTKIGVMKALLKKVDCLLIGGGMSYTFLKAKGINIGNSLLEESLVKDAKDLLESYPEKILLPSDVVVAKSCKEGAETLIIDISKDGIPPGYEGLDIGPKTIKEFKNKLDLAKTILWNGPLGVYEIKDFAQGTYSIAKHLAVTDAITIVGGGDVIAAVNQAGVSKKISHISTGGGATLEYIEFGSLPGVDALSDKM